MTDNLETALRAALGLPDPDTETFHQDNPEAPLALNDDYGLRAIIMRDIRDHAANTARQKQNSEVLHTMIQTIQK